MNDLYIVMYHYVRELKKSRYPNIKGLDFNLFKQQIAFFEKNFNIITMEQVINAIKGNGELPENALLLTFDDGYIDNYTYVFPLLMEKKLQGTFFPPAKILVENCVLDVNKIHYLLANIEEEILFDDVLHQLDYYRSTKCPYSTNTELIKQYAVASRFDTAKTVFIKMMLQTVIPSNIRKIIIDNLFTKYSEVSEETLANELYVSASQLKVMKS